MNSNNSTFTVPSEEKINGKAYEMTVHLVHADQQGKLAVVAVRRTVTSINSSTVRNAVKCGEV